MAWYEGTYSCGHEGRTNVTGPTKTRKWWIDRHFEGLCLKCAEKERKEEQERKNREAEERSEEMELPKLKGTEKQIKWANTIRVSIIDKMEEQLAEFDEKISEAKKRIEKEEREGREKKHSLKDLKLYVPESGYSFGWFQTSKEELYDAVNYAIQNHVDAGFWIDNRNRQGIFADFITEYRKMDSIPEEVKKEKEDMEKEATVIPEMPGCGSRKTGVVKMEYSADTSILAVSYIKDAEFMETVKPLGYRWTGNAWAKHITEYTGGMADRAAELGNMLLGKGFTVQFPDTETKDAAVAGNFKPENDRWVKYSTEKGKLAIRWEKRSDALYESAKKLPGARWNSGVMYVGTEFYKEVEDFAETMGFSISERARGEIREYREREAGFETAKVKEATVKTGTDAERIAKALKSGGTIIEDLKDD